MTQVNSIDKVETYTTEDSSQFSLMALLVVLAKHKKKLIGLPIFAAVVTAAISLVLPNEYYSSVKLLPPQQSQSSATALLSQLGGIAGMAGVAGVKNQNDVYVSMLKSRTVADRIISRFDLKKVYETESQEKARTILEKNTSVNSGKDGLITIGLYDRDKERVAKLANAYVDELVELNRLIAVTDASKRRLFFERQLELAKNGLAAAETALKGGLDRGGMISVDAETRAILETTGRLRAQISAKEIQLNSLRPFMTSNNPEFLRVQEELNSLKGELSRLENGNRDAESRDANVGEGLENIKTLREVKYRQMLYELLAKQYEVARLDEAKEVSLIQVLDPAVVPERKARPVRSIMVFVAAVVGMLVALLWISILEAKKRAIENALGKRQWDELRTHLKFR